MSCAIFASSVGGLTTKDDVPRSSTSSIRFPRLPSKSRLDSILLTLTRNTLVHARRKKYTITDLTYTRQRSLELSQMRCYRKPMFAAMFNENFSDLFLYSRSTIQ